MSMFKGFLNEKGNVVPAAREALKQKAMEKYLADVLANGTKNTNGGYSVALAEDENGATIYLNVSCTVSNNDPFKEKAKKEKVAAKPAEFELPTLD